MSLPGSLSSVFILTRNGSIHLKLNAEIQSIIIYFAYVVNHFSISKRYVNRSTLSKIINLAHTIRKNIFKDKSIPR